MVYIIMNEEENRAFLINKAKDFVANAKNPITSYDSPQYEPLKQHISMMNLRFVRLQDSSLISYANIYADLKKCLVSTSNPMSVPFIILKIALPLLRELKPDQGDKESLFGILTDILRDYHSQLSQQAAMLFDLLLSHYHSKTIKFLCEYKVKSKEFMDLIRNITFNDNKEVCVKLIGKIAPKIHEIIDNKKTSADIVSKVANSYICALNRIPEVFNETFFEKLFSDYKSFKTLPKSLISLSYAIHSSKLDSKHFSKITKNNVLLQAIEVNELTEGTMFLIYGMLVRNLQPEFLVSFITSNFPKGIFKYPNLLVKIIYKFSQKYEEQGKEVLNKIAETEHYGSIANYPIMYNSMRFSIIRQAVASKNIPVLKSSLNAMYFEPAIPILSDLLKASFSCEKVFQFCLVNSNFIVPVIVQLSESLSQYSKTPPLLSSIFSLLQDLIIHTIQIITYERSQGLTDDVFCKSEVLIDDAKESVNFHLIDASCFYYFTSSFHEIRMKSFEVALYNFNLFKEIYPDWETKNENDIPFFNYIKTNVKNSSKSIFPSVKELLSTYRGNYGDFKKWPNEFDLLLQNNSMRDEYLVKMFLYGYKSHDNFKTSFDKILGTSCIDNSVCSVLHLLTEKNKVDDLTDIIKSQNSFVLKSISFLPDKVLADLIELAKDINNDISKVSVINSIVLNVLYKENNANILQKCLCLLLEMQKPFVSSLMNKSNSYSKQTNRIWETYMHTIILIFRQLGKVDNAKTLKSFYESVFSKIIYRINGHLNRSSSDGNVSQIHELSFIFLYQFLLILYRSGAEFQIVNAFSWMMKTIEIFPMGRAVLIVEQFLEDLEHNNKSLLIQCLKGIPFTSVDSCYAHSFYALKYFDQYGADNLNSTIFSSLITIQNDLSNTSDIFNLLKQIDWSRYIKGTSAPLAFTPETASLEFSKYFRILAEDFIDLSIRTVVNNETQKSVRALLEIIIKPWFAQNDLSSHNSLGRVLSLLKNPAIKKQSLAGFFSFICPHMKEQSNLVKILIQLDKADSEIWWEFYKYTDDKQGLINSWVSYALSGITSEMFMYLLILAYHDNFVQIPKFVLLLISLQVLQSKDFLNQEVIEICNMSNSLNNIRNQEEFLESADQHILQDLIISTIFLIGLEIPEYNRNLYQLFIRNHNEIINCNVHEIAKIIHIYSQHNSYTDIKSLIMFVFSLHSSSNGKLKSFINELAIYFLDSSDKDVFAECYKIAEIKTSITIASTIFRGTLETDESLKFINLADLDSNCRFWIALASGTEIKDLPTMSSVITALKFSTTDILQKLSNKIPQMISLGFDINPVLNFCLNLSQVSFSRIINFLNQIPKEIPLPDSLDMSLEYEFDYSSFQSSKLNDLLSKYY